MSQEDRSSAESLGPRLVGLTEEEATAEAAGAGCHLRVGERDGESYPMTMDYQPSRITVVIRNGIVASVVSVG